MPDEYRIDVVPAAEKALARLPQDIQQRISRMIRALATTPRPPGVRMLQGGERLYRIRSGPYRVVYEIDDRRHVVTIRIIGHRRDIYRGL